MYRRILLASYQSREGLIALREGALLAASCGAETFLLVIELGSYGARMASGIHPLPVDESANELLSIGLERLRSLGVNATGEVIVGEPAPVIGAAARRFGADLVLVGHRRQGLLDRWWSGSSGAFLVDNVDCSVLLARTTISDEAFEECIRAVKTAAPQ